MLMSGQQFMSVLFPKPLLAAAGSFPMAFAAVYVLGAIAAFSIGFMALQKAREVNAEALRQSDEAQDN